MRQKLNFFYCEQKMAMIYCTENSTILMKNNRIFVYRIPHNSDNPITDKKPFMELSVPGMQEIYPGGDHFFLKISGDFYYHFGADNNGQLGTGDKKNFVNFEFNLNVTNLKPKKIACGASFTAVLTKSGDVFFSGNNEFGQLGINSTTDLFEFKKNNFFNSTVKDIACISFGCIYVEISGIYYSGHMSDTKNDNGYSCYPKIISVGNEKVKIFTGANHFVVMYPNSSKTTLFAIGYDREELSSYELKVTPERIYCYGNFMMLFLQNKCYCWKLNFEKVTNIYFSLATPEGFTETKNYEKSMVFGIETYRIPELDNASYITGGLYHMVAVTPGGIIKGGSNLLGQLEFE